MGVGMSMRHIATALRALLCLVLLAAGAEASAQGLTKQEAERQARDFELGRATEVLANIMREFGEGFVEDGYEPLVDLNGDDLRIARGKLGGKATDTGADLKDHRLGIIGALLCYFLGNYSVCKEVLTELLAEGDACVCHNALDHR